MNKEKKLNSHLNQQMKKFRRKTYLNHKSLTPEQRQKRMNELLKD